MTMTQVGQLFLLYWCTAASCVHDRGEIGECSQTCSSSELQTALYPARQTEASAHPKPTNTDDQQAWLNKNGVRTHWLGKALLVCFKPKSWKDLQLMHIWLRPIITWIMPSQQALTIFVLQRTWGLARNWSNSLVMNLPNLSCQTRPGLQSLTMKAAAVMPQVNTRIE